MALPSPIVGDIHSVNHLPPPVFVAHGELCLFPCQNPVTVAAWVYNTANTLMLTFKLCLLMSKQWKAFFFFICMTPIKQNVDHWGWVSSRYIHCGNNSGEQHNILKCYVLEVKESWCLTDFEWMIHHKTASSGLVLLSLCPQWSELGAGEAVCFNLLCFFIKDLMTVTHKETII